jgi:hypothetical protein
MAATDSGVSGLSSLESFPEATQQLQCRISDTEMMKKRVVEIRLIVL